MKDILISIVQAVVQGLTEFLPVSSSGHLSLVQHFFGISGESSVFVSIILHLGTLVAVIIAFRELVSKLIVEFFSLVKDVFTGKFKWSEMNPNRRMIMMIVISILPLFAFYIFKDFFKDLSSDNDIIVEGFAFLYTSALLFLSDKCMNGKKTAGDLKVKDALSVGVFQGIALVPGISRSGSTISAGLFRGMKKETAIEYSFVLGIPVILAGALSEIMDISSVQASSINWIALAIGFVVSAITGFFAIKMIRWLIKSNKFKIFAYYTLVLGITVIAVGICERISGETIINMISK